MIARFEGTRLCPITGQELATDCWNMQHAEEPGTKSEACRRHSCRCWCHTGGPQEEEPVRHARQPDKEELDSST